MRVWLHAIVAAAVGGATTGATTAVGTGNVRAIGFSALAGALVAIAALLKQSPIPPGPPA